MTGFLTTHVLDTARGRPASGMSISLHGVSGDSRREITRMVTNADGRTDTPILPESRFETGVYELEFFAGDYLESKGLARETLFLDRIPIRFAMTEYTHYHVPLLLSPFGYSTYRGS